MTIILMIIAAENKTLCNYASTTESAFVHFEFVKCVT